MNKSIVASELILTIGVLVAISIALFQLKNVFYGQQTLSQEAILISFAEDLETTVDKILTVQGNATFVYKPVIKKYVVDVKTNAIFISDKISGKNVTLFKSGLAPNYFEDSEIIYITKADGKVRVSGGKHKIIGERCTASAECDSGYCWGVSSTTFRCQEKCAPNGYFAPDESSCCSGYLSETGRCKKFLQPPECQERRKYSGCTPTLEDVKPPYNLCSDRPYDYIGVYCSGNVRKLVDGCIISHTLALDRVKCLIDWAYSNFPQVYDHSNTGCACVGRFNLGPDDIISCVNTKKFPRGCQGCGRCIDFSTTLYSLLISCGKDCAIDTDSLYIANGYVMVNGVCGSHSWLLYKHPGLGWVFVDPTNPSYTQSLDGYFGRISSYPCITFELENLEHKCIWSTPDGEVRSNMCKGWGSDLSGCPS